MLARIARSYKLLGRRSYVLPKPTWKLADLELDRDHPPVSIQQLDLLSRRALINVQDLEQKDQLRQDLGNLLHMIDQVSSFHTADVLEDADLYDVPRGVTSAPVRDDTEQQSSDNNTIEYLRPKLKVDGGQEFFEIQTKK